MIVHYSTKGVSLLTTEDQEGVLCNIVLCVCVHGGHCQWSLHTVSLVTVTILLTTVAPFVATVIFRQNVPNPLFIDVMQMYIQCKIFIL